MGSAICKVSLIPGPSTPQEYLRFGLYRFRSPLLTGSISLSFPPLTEMFHFSGSRDRNPMYSGYVNSPFRLLGYPIRIPPDLSSLAAPRGFSQLAASFFAFQLQGILHKPFSLSLLFSKGSLLFSPPSLCFARSFPLQTLSFLEIVFPLAEQYCYYPAFPLSHMSICCSRFALSLPVLEKFAPVYRQYGW